MWMLIPLALANAAITITVVSSKLFRPLRDALKGKFLGELVSCPYCFSHYPAFMLALGCGEGPLWMVLYWFGTVALTAPVMALLAFSLNYLNLFEGDA